MAQSGPIPSELTKVDVGGVKLVSSTRVNPWANHSTKSNAGQSTGNTMSQQGFKTRNIFVNAPMKIESKSTELGNLPSVMDTGTTSLVNAAQKPVSKTLSSQGVVFVPLQPPLPCVQRLEQATIQNSFQAASDTLLWVGNNAPVTAQTLQNNFLPQLNQSSAEKIYVPNLSPTLNQSLSKSPRGVSPTAKDQLSHFKRQQSSHDVAGLLRNFIIKKGNGSVSSSPKCSRPSQFASSYPQPQQKCVLVKHIPNLLSNSRGKPSKHLADVGENSIVKQQISAIKVVPSTQKLEGNQPVYLAKPTLLSEKTPKESNILVTYLVSSPNQPPTLISQSLLGPSMPPSLSNQNSSSSSAKVTHYRVGQGSPPHSSPKVCTSNTPVVQVKRTCEQEQGSMQQPSKKPKSTFPAISIKKEPEDNYQGVLSSTKTRTIIQNPLPTLHLPGVSNKFMITQVGNIGDSNSVNANNKLLGNCLTRTDTISAKNQATAPSRGTSETLNSSSHLTTGTIVTANVAPCPKANAMCSFIYPTNTKQTFDNNTLNHAPTRLMKTFIVTDKSGKTSVFKVPSSTPASHLLYTLSNQCKEKKLQLKTAHQKGGRDSAEGSAGAVVIVRKVNEGVKEGEQKSLKPKETGSKAGVDLEHGLSKDDDRTNKMGVKEGEQRTLKTEQVVPKTDGKINVDSTQTGLQRPKSKSAEDSNIVTKSITPTRKRISHRRRRKKRAFRTQSHRRQTKYLYEKVTIHDHNYSFQPKSSTVTSADENKTHFKDKKTSTSIDSESAKKVCYFETQVTEDNSIILPGNDHYPEKQIKLEFPKVVLKPLKLKHVDHFKTIFLSESPVIEVNQVETKTSPWKVQDSLGRSDQNSDVLNLEDSMGKDEFPHNLSNLTELRDLGTVLPSRMAESLTVSVGGNVEVESEVTIRCEDDLSQTPGTSPLEKQVDETMEIPSDLSLMTSKDRIKILRERMRRREREIEALMRKGVKQESP